MSPEHTKQLIEDFPTLYGNLDPRSPMAWYGFQCADGWFDLLYGLSAKVAAVSPAIKVIQVKDKFHELRFYTTHGGLTQEQKDTFYDHIREAEIASRLTCEICGNPVEPSDDWQDWSDCKSHRGTDGT